MIRPVIFRLAAEHEMLEAERWFERGLELEQSDAPASQVIEAYQKALELH